jgi:hypothetical protein
MAEVMGTFLLVDGKRSTMTIYFAPGNTVRKLYVVLLAIQGNHIVDGGFFTVVIANGRLEARRFIHSKLFQSSI